MKAKNFIKKSTLIILSIVGTTTLKAQAIQVKPELSDVHAGSRVDITGKTTIYYTGDGDGLDIVTRNSPTVLRSDGALIWGAFHQAQPNNPNLFSLTSYSAIPWYSCFTIKATGNTGIFNENPSVALEIGSPSSIRQVKVNGSIVWGSDTRMKKNITDISNSLSKLKQLRSVSYNFKEDESEQPISERFLKEGISIEKMKEDIKNAPKTNAYLSSRNFYGFLAQDVQELFPDLVYKDSAGMLSVDYIGIIPLLVNGLKEQQIIIENLQKDYQQKIESLEKTLSACCNTGKLRSAEASMQSGHDYANAMELNDAKMIVYQNVPNPFNENTTIQCYIPQNIQKVQLCIYDMQGVQVKCLPVPERGTSNVQIEAGQLTAGIYTYILIGDGKTSEAKQMILTR